MRSSHIIADKIVEALSWQKLSGGGVFTDYDPLVVIMYHVARKIENRGGSFDKPEARTVWLKAVEALQEDNLLLEHNDHFPCRYCSLEFAPVIDERLLEAFLTWYRSMSTENLLAIHRCLNCGGQIRARHTKVYTGDFHTPAPGTVEDDDAWCESLFEHASM
jgi:hypothetical protein